MPNNYFVEKRRQDKQNLLKIFEKTPDMEERKAIALFSLQTGYRLETVKRMLEELKEAGML